MWRTGEKEPCPRFQYFSWYHVFIQKAHGLVVRLIHHSHTFSYFIFSVPKHVHHYHHFSIITCRCYFSTPSTQRCWVFLDYINIWFTFVCNESLFIIDSVCTDSISWLFLLILAELSVLHTSLKSIFLYLSFYFLLLLVKESIIIIVWTWWMII